jgi:NADPH-dependent curcumin reductase CurA
VLVRTRYISLDAANRAWMWGATYRSAVKQGDVMAGGAIAEVVESKATPAFQARRPRLRRYRLAGLRRPPG